MCIPKITFENIIFMQMDYQPIAHKFSIQRVPGSKNVATTNIENKIEQLKCVLIMTINHHETASS